MPCVLGLSLECSVPGPTRHRRAHHWAARCQSSWDDWVGLAQHVVEADEVGGGDENSFAAAVRDLYVRLDGIGAPGDVRDHTAMNVLDMAFERVPRDGGHRRQHAEGHRHPAQQWHGAVAFGLLPKQLVQ